MNSAELLEDIVRATGKAGELQKSREAALVITKLDEARLWVEEYRRKVSGEDKQQSAALIGEGEKCPNCLSGVLVLGCCNNCNYGC